MLTKQGKEQRDYSYYTTSLPQSWRRMQEDIRRKKYTSALIEWHLAKNALEEVGKYLEGQMEP